jgi:hypothetical protein
MLVVWRLLGSEAATLYRQTFRARSPNASNSLPRDNPILLIGVESESAVKIVSGRMLETVVGCLRDQIGCMGSDEALYELRLAGCGFRRKLPSMWRSLEAPHG